MSLRIFHVFFIGLSVLLAVGFGVWALGLYATEHSAGYLAAALGSFLTGGALIVYGAKFLQKCRRVGIT